MKYFKSLFIVLVVFFSNNICSQTFKEILNYYDNSDQPKEVLYKNEDLIKVKYISYFPDGTIENLYNYDPLSQKKHGSFSEKINLGNLSFESQGNFNQGVLNCNNYHQLGQGSITKGKILNGYPIGVHKVFSIHEKYGKTYSPIRIRNQIVYVDREYGTGEYREKWSHNISFDENGLLDCEFEFGSYDKTLLNYKNGKLISYMKKDKDGTFQDSVVYGAKLVKLNGGRMGDWSEYRKAPDEIFENYDYFENPFEFEFRTSADKDWDGVVNMDFIGNINNLKPKPINFLKLTELRKKESNFKSYINYNEVQLSLNDRGIYYPNFFSFYNLLSKTSNKESRELFDDWIFSNGTSFGQLSYFCDVYFSKFPSSTFTNHDLPYTENYDDLIHNPKIFGVKAIEYDDGTATYSLPSLGRALLKVLNIENSPILDFYLTSLDGKYGVSLRKHVEQFENDIEKKALAKKKAIAKEKSEKEECMKNLENHILKINTIEGITPINAKGQIPSKLDDNWQKFLKNENDIIAVACVLEIKKISNPIYGYDKSNFKNYFKQYRYDDKVYRDLNYMPYSWIIQTGFSNNCATYFLPWANSSMLTKLFSKDSNEDSISGANAGKIIESNNWGTIIK